MAADTWMSRAEAARYAGVHYNTLRLWESGGRLTPKRDHEGDRIVVRISKRQLDAILAERPEAPERPAEGQVLDAVMERLAAMESELRDLRRILAGERTRQGRVMRLLAGKE